MSGRKVINSLQESELRGKRVLVRVDFNVPLETGRLDPNVQGVADKTKITATMPTIQFLNKVGARIVLCSHLGRPKGRDLSLSLEPIANVLKEMLAEYGVQVKFVKDCIGSDASVQKEALEDGEILLLENLRFHDEEIANDRTFARELAQHMDIFVNDAFGSSHRGKTARIFFINARYLRAHVKSSFAAHASTVGVTEYIPHCYAGLLMNKELVFLGGALRNPNRPLVAVVGGAKVSSKLGVLLNLLDKVDKLIVGGAMVYTFYRAMGYSVGDSLVEEDLVQTADTIMKAAEHRKVPLILATDSHIVPTDTLKQSNGHKAPPTSPMALDTSGYATHTLEKAGAQLAPAVAVAPTAEGPLYVPLTEQSKRIVKNEQIPAGWTGVDIGPASINLFVNELELSQTVLWNGTYDLMR